MVVLLLVREGYGFGYHGDSLYLEGRRVEVDNDGDFIAALRDDSISRIVLTRDMKLGKEWDNPQNLFPLHIRRNVTIKSSLEADAFASLDFRYLSGKLLLEPDAWLTIYRLRLRGLTASSAPSFPFVALSRGGNVLFRDCLLHRLSCLPMELVYDSIQATANAGLRQWPRPAPTSPGLEAAAAGAARDTEAAASASGREENAMTTELLQNFCFRTVAGGRECRPHALRLHTYAYATQRKGGGVVGTGGFTLWAENTTMVCDYPVSEECVRKQGPEFCVARELSRRLREQGQRSTWLAVAAAMAVTAAAVAVGWGWLSRQRPSALAIRAQPRPAGAVAELVAAAVAAAEAEAEADNMTAWGLPAGLGNLAGSPCMDAFSAGRTSVSPTLSRASTRTLQRDSANGTAPSHTGIASGSAISGHGGGDGGLFLGSASGGVAGATSVSLGFPRLRQGSSSERTSGALMSCQEDAVQGVPAQQGVPRAPALPQQQTEQLFTQLQLQQLTQHLLSQQLHHVNTQRTQNQYQQQALIQQALVQATTVAGQQPLQQQRQQPTAQQPSQHQPSHQQQGPDGGVAVLARQFGWCEVVNGGGLEDSSVGSAKGKAAAETQERIENLRRSITNAHNVPREAYDNLEVTELLGSGTFGRVYKGFWNGTMVAVKLMVFPAALTGSSQREAMAAMEAAISTSLSHPNIVQTYTWRVAPLPEATSHWMGQRPAASSPPVPRLVVSPLVAARHTAPAATARGPEDSHDGERQQQQQVAEGHGCGVPVDGAPGGRPTGEGLGTAGRQASVPSEAGRGLTRSPSLPVPTTPSQTACEQHPRQERVQLPADHLPPGPPLPVPLPTPAANAAAVANNGAGAGAATAAGPMVEGGFELCLILEFCDCGSLRDRLAVGGFKLAPGSATPMGSGSGPGWDAVDLGDTAHQGPAAAMSASYGADVEYGSVDYGAVLDVAMDVARAMSYLHLKNIIHSDLKSRNVLLKSISGNPWALGRRCSVTAKVSDFGLALRIDQDATHMSNMFQGTTAFMAPELLLYGRVSKASDVYSFGILLWELYTCGESFKGVPRALLSARVIEGLRPDFPPEAPPEYVRLAQQCWAAEAADRPTFDYIVRELTSMRCALYGDRSTPTGGPQSTSVTAQLRRLKPPAGAYALADTALGPNAHQLQCGAAAASAAASGSPEGRPLAQPPQPRPGLMVVGVADGGGDGGGESPSRRLRPLPLLTGRVANISACVPGSGGGGCATGAAAELRVVPSAEEMAAAEAGGGDRRRRGTVIGGVDDPRMQRLIDANLLVVGGSDGGSTVVGL